MAAITAKYQSVCSKPLIYCKHCHLAVIRRLRIQLQLRYLAEPGLLDILIIFKYMYIYLIPNFGRNSLVYIYVHKYKMLHISEYYFV